MFTVGACNAMLWNLIQKLAFDPLHGWYISRFDLKMDRHFNMKSTMPYNTLDEKIYLAYNKDVELQGRRPYTYLRGSSWRHRNAERLERFLASRFGRTSTSVKLVAILLTLVFMNLVYLLASRSVHARPKETNPSH